MYSYFRFGWRPVIGWVCAAGLAFQFLIAPTLTWYFVLTCSKIQLSDPNAAVMVANILAALSLATIRGIENTRVAKYGNRDDTGTNKG